MSGNATKSSRRMTALNIRSRLPNRDRAKTHIVRDLRGGLELCPPRMERGTKRTREIGVDRVLFGSDGCFGGGVTPARALADFHSLPLSKAEFQTIESNVTPICVERRVA